MGGSSMRKTLMATMFIGLFAFLLLIMMGMFNVPCTHPTERALCKKEICLLRGYLLCDDFYGISFFGDEYSCTNEIAFRVGCFCERVNRISRRRIGQDVFRVVALPNRNERIIADGWGTPYNFISIEECQRNNWNALKYSAVSNIVIWSSGPNRINEHGTNDDVVLPIMPRPEIDKSGRPAQ